MIQHDPFGNPVVIGSAASAAPLADFVEGFAASETRVGGILPAANADPDSLLLQAYAAMLHLFAESPAGPRHAAPFVARIDALLARPTASGRYSERERAFAQGIRAWADRDIAQAIAWHSRGLADAPRDLVALKLVHSHCFNLGDSPAMLRLALPSLRAAGDLAYVHGMTAFAYEQCHLLPQAEACARQGIALRPSEPWAHHALAHVMLTEGRLQEGLAFLQSVQPTWTGLNSFMDTHLWWHLCLFLIEFERFDDVLALYDRQVWGVAKDYCQDQIGAVSLLARLELAGVDVGDRWQELGEWLTTRTADQTQPFLDLQYLYGLARAARPEADVLLRNLQAFAPTAPAISRPAWVDVCEPAARGLLAHARGDHATTVEQLGRALPRLLEIGGSHAQRDLFEQIHLDALWRCGRLVAVQNQLQPRLPAWRESTRLHRRLASLHRELGIEAATAVPHPA